MVSPLLAANHMPLLNVDGRCWLLLKYYSAKKVCRRASLGFDPPVATKALEFVQIALGGVPYIVPERLPLLVLVPDVGALERWDDVPNVP